MQTRFLNVSVLCQNTRSLVSELIVDSADSWPRLVITPRLGEGGQLPRIGHVPLVADNFGQGVRSHL